MTFHINNFSTNTLTIVTARSIVITCFVGIVVLAGGHALAQSVPVPPSAHPRLFVRQNDIPLLRQRFNNPQLAEVRIKLLQEAKSVTNGINTNGRPQEKIWRSYQANAFIYLIDRDEAAGKKACQLVGEFFESLGTAMKPGQDQFDLWDSRRCYQAILAAAMVYDWCYNLLSEEDKQRLIHHIDRIGYLIEYKELGGWPLDPNQLSLREFICPHWAELKHPVMLAFGIACYNEDSSLYHSMADHLYHHFVPARNFSYQSHRHPAGTAYGQFRIEADLLTTVLMTHMGFPRPYSPDQGLMHYYFTYLRRPDGHLMTEGDDYNIQRAPHRYQGMNALLLAASEFKNSHYQSEILRYWNPFLKEDHYNPTWVMLFFDPRIMPKPIEDLPLTAYYPSPAGSMIARTGWDILGGPRADTAIVKMDIHDRNISGHSHSDAGNFTIYYKGPLAIESGAYAVSPDGKQYGGSHFRHYYTQSVAHNTLLISNGSNPSGGQIDSPREYQDFDQLLKRSKRGDVWAHDFGPDQTIPDYTLLKGDIAAAYKNVDHAVRTFVFHNLHSARHPACLIVYDQVQSNTPTQVHWLLHAHQEPHVERNAVVINKTQGRQDYDGQLINHLLLPELGQVNIQAIGGPNKEFWANGKNWPLKNPQDIDRYEAGRWRIEIVNKSPLDQIDFINVLQVKPASGSDQPLSVSKTDMDPFWGVQIADRLTLLPKTLQTVDRKIVLGLLKGKCLITGLAPGQWSIVTPQRQLIRVQVIKQAQTIYLTVKSPGMHIIQPD